MQTLDDQTYTSYLKWFRVKRSKDITNLSFAIIYAQLIQIMLNDIIDYCFGPDSKGKWVFWLGACVVLRLVFIFWDTIIYYMYINVKKKPKLFESLVALDKMSSNDFNKDMMDHAYDILHKSMSPKPPHMSFEYDEEKHLNPSQKPRKHRYITEEEKEYQNALWKWSWIIAIARVIKIVRPVLEGYSLALFLSTIVDWIFPGKNTSKLVSWLVVLCLFSLFGVGIDCFCGKYENTLLQQLPKEIFTHAGHDDENTQSKHRQNKPPKIAHFSKVDVES